MCWGQIGQGHSSSSFLFILLWSEDDSSFYSPPLLLWVWGRFCVAAAATVSFEKQIGLQGQKLGSCNSVTLRFRTLKRNVGKGESGSQNN